MHSTLALFAACLLATIAAIPDAEEGWAGKYLPGRPEPIMAYNTHRMLYIEVSAVELPGNCELMSYAYANKEVKFEIFFHFPLPGLHDVLFGELVIILYENKKTMLGIVKVHLKQFLEEKECGPELRSEYFEVAKPSYYGKADFYERASPTIGKVCCRFKITGDADADAEALQSATHSSDIFGFLFAKDTAQMYRIAYDLFRTTQRGTLLCRMHWVFGLVSAEYYYNNIYGECRVPNCDGASCGMPFCRASYGRLPRPELENAIEMLQYAAAAFANSFVTWRLEKRRNVTDIRDDRRKAILERLDIEDSDLIVDDRGDGHSLAYIAFFSRGRLVLSFKGTTCSAEAMHDLNCDYTEFQDGYAHRGIKQLAERFLDKCWGNLCEEMGSRNVTELVLTGQSLGAAASLLIYLVMQERGLDRGLTVSVTCFAAPPVVSVSIADRPLPNVKVYNYGHDIVTRLNFGSVLDLKYICISISSLYDYFTDKKLVVQKIAEIKQHIARTNMNTKLYIPGTLIHILDCSEKSGRAFLYKHVQHKFFEDIICSRRAPFDHIIHRTLSALKHSLDAGDEQAI